MRPDIGLDFAHCGVCGSNKCDGHEVHFLRPHQPCGYIKIADGYKVALNKYPNWFHRMMVRLILGWRFERVEKEKR